MKLKKPAYEELERICEELRGELQKRKQVDEVLRASEERFRSTFDQAAVGIAHVGLDGKWLRLNDKLCTILGYSQEELVKMTFLDISYPEGLELELNYVRRLLADEIKIFSMEKRYLRKDSSIIWVNLTVTLVRGSAGDPTYYISVIEDITERKKTEEALRASEEKYRTLVESSSDAILMLDKHRKIVSCNQAFYNLFGFDKNEAEGKSVRIIHESLDSFIAFGKLAYPIIDKKGFSRTEWNLMNKDGKVFPVEMVISTIKSFDGSLMGYVNIVRDITERKKMEQELKNANKELEAFSYSVSHDLKAPLLNIASFAKLLQKVASGALNEKSQGYLTNIQESAKRMEDLINDLLAFSRIGHAEIHKKPINMEKLIKEVIEIFQPDTKGRDIVWNLNSLPEVNGDHAMLRVVLTNLISNALKFTRSRKPTLIEIGCLNSGDDGDETVFFVQDNGVGFDMQHVDKLFGVFQRLHSNKEFEGTGIGLATVQRIIQGHGGRVWAEGAMDKGAVFYFSLPKSSLWFHKAHYNS